MTKKLHLDFSIAVDTEKQLSKRTLTTINRSIRGGRDTYNYAVQINQSPIVDLTVREWAAILACIQGTRAYDELHRVVFTEDEIVERPELTLAALDSILEELYVLGSVRV